MLASAAGMEEMRKELAELYGVPPESIILTLDGARGGHRALSGADEAPAPLSLTVTLVEPADPDAAAALEDRMEHTDDDALSHALHAHAQHSAPEVLHVAKDDTLAAAAAAASAAAARPVSSSAGTGWGGSVGLALLALLVVLGLGALVTSKLGHELPGARSLPPLPSISSLLHGARQLPVRHVRLREAGGRQNTSASPAASRSLSTRGEGVPYGGRDFKAEAERMRMKLREQEAAGKAKDTVTAPHQQDTQSGRAPPLYNGAMHPGSRSASPVRSISHPPYRDLRYPPPSVTVPPVRSMTQRTYGEQHRSPAPPRPPAATWNAQTQGYSLPHANYSPARSQSAGHAPHLPACGRGEQATSPYGARPASRGDTPTSNGKSSRGRRVFGI